jgi:hypothetical protein
MMSPGQGAGDERYRVDLSKEIRLGQILGTVHGHGERCVHHLEPILALFNLELCGRSFSVLRSAAAASPVLLFLSLSIPINNNPGSSQTQAPNSCSTREILLARSDRIKASQSS